MSPREVDQLRVAERAQRLLQLRYDISEHLAKHGIWGKDLHKDGPAYFSDGRVIHIPPPITPRRSSEFRLTKDGRLAR